MAFKDSPECEEWIEETGGRDEDLEEYFERYRLRTGNADW